MESYRSSTRTDLVCPLWKVIYTTAWVNTWLLSYYDPFKVTKTASFWKVQYYKTGKSLRLPGGEDEPPGIFSVDCGELIETRPISPEKESCASTVFSISFSFTTQFSKVREMLLSVHKNFGIQVIESENLSVLETVNTKGVN